MLEQWGILRAVLCLVSPGALWLVNVLNLVPGGRELRESARDAEGDTCTGQLILGAREEQAGKVGRRRSRKVWEVGAKPSVSRASTGPSSIL